MGKNKAQRTKNNAKPSSSGRSAELLGTAIPNFIGFSAVKDGGYVPVLPGLSITTINDLEINSIDPHFQLVLKKMNKKDATTKFKALQEFANMCKESPLSTVEAVVSFWPRFYHTLVCDIEHRVREAAQLAHAALVKRVGRGIAQYLKQLAGPWFTSQFDTYPPAASAATNSFEETFPQKKSVDAIVHCQEEILSYISNNIIVETPQSINTNKTSNLTSEELENKYQRLLVCNLQGYCYYFNKVSLEHVEETISIHHKIVSNNKFWELSKYESTSIKSAFYNVLTAIITNVKYLLHNERKRTITAIMNSLDESEPGTLSAVWECMLVAIDKIDDWYNVINIEKLALPKLWRVLRSGGQGCASVIYPSLLPFISQFPKFNIDNKKKLFINFFANMRGGFDTKTAQISRSEMLAITKAFTECFRYTILLNSNDIELCEQLIRDQLIPVIKSCIKEFSPFKIILFNEVAELLHHWSKNRDRDDKSYSLLISKFWSELELLFQRLIDNSNNEFDRFTIANFYDAQLKFLISLKNEDNATTRNVSVTFVDAIDLEKKREEQRQQLEKINTTSTFEDEIFFNELNQFVRNLCIGYLKNYRPVPPTSLIVHLNRIIKNFESKTLFTEIIKSYRNDENLLEFYNDNLKNWLLNKDIETMDVIQFIFTFIKYMNDEEKNSVINSIMQFNDKSILNNFIICVLTEKNRNDRLIRMWCENNYVAEYLQEVVKKLVIHDKQDETDEHLLLMAFESIDGQLSVNENAINNVATILCEYLKKNDPTSVERIIELTSRLLKLTWSYEKLTNGSLEMLKTLFEMDVQDKLSITMKESMRNHWTNGFTMICNKLSHEKLFEILKDYMKIIYDKIYQSNDTNIDEIVDIALNFVQALNNFNYYNALSMIVKLNYEERDVFDIWIPQFSNIVLHAEIISGNFHLVNPIRSIPLDCPPIFIVSESEKLPNRAGHCLLWALFNGQLMNKLISKLSNDDMKNEIESDTSESLSNFSQVLNGILLITSITTIYCKHYKSTNNYDSINKKSKLLKNECKKLRESLPTCIWEKIVSDSQDIKNYWMEFGSIFAEFLRYFHGNDEHLLEVHEQGCEILKKYLHAENTSLTLVDHMNAVVLARNLLDDVTNYSLCADIFKKMINRHEINREFLLFNCDIGNVDWSNYCLPLEVMRLCTKFVNTVPTEMSSGVWEAVMIFLASWELSLDKSKHHHHDLKVQCLIVAISQLFCSVQSVINEREEKLTEELATKLLDEWQNVFSDDANRQMINIWMYYANLYNENNDYLTPILILQYLGDAVKLIDGNTFFQSYSGYSTLTITSEQLMKFSFKLIPSYIPSLQLAAYYSLNHLVPRLVEQDKNTIEQDNFDVKSLNIYKFESVLSDVQRVVDKMLMDFKLCDDVSCIIQPYTDCYSYGFAYLLTWSNILNMCAHAHADLRYQYGEILKEKFFSSLMSNIFRLLPGEILQDTKTRIAPTHLMELFRKLPILNFGDSLSEWKLDHIVCGVYGNCLRHLPVLVRQWWSTIESRVGNAVERITTVYVSPILCQEELMNKKLVDVENLQIKVHPTVREIAATYEMDDTKLELNMILPINYPLGPVVVEPGQHAGSAAIRRNCHMQLSIFLTHQNGSIWDALMMWKKNLDKKFSGVEECYICFSIFHINTSQIPKLSCHTCRKKFHAPCLYKWFSTSQKSTCPICRNIF